MASIVVVGPHPDDQELGMGGTIARLARQGHTVHLIDMTNYFDRLFAERKAELPQSGGESPANNDGSARIKV